MSRDNDAIGGPFYAPTAFAKIRDKRAELEAAIAAGTLTRDEAATQLNEFRSLQIAHSREHGSEPKA